MAEAVCHKIISIIAACYINIQVVCLHLILSKYWYDAHTRFQQIFYEDLGIIITYNLAYS